MEPDHRFREGQYDPVYELYERQGLTQLGLSVNYTWWNDPKRLTFVLARYKFVSRMLEGFGHVLEVGCGDAFASRIVRQAVERLTVSDFDMEWLQDTRQRLDQRWPMELLQHDFVQGPLAPGFDAAYLLDVIEHIPPEHEHCFLANVVASCGPSGVVIMGTPSLESQQYASPISKQGHVNCKTGQQLKQLAQKFFHTVFLFSMNDEVVHTGFERMAHYLFAVCSHPRVRDSEPG